MKKSLFTLGVTAVLGTALVGNAFAADTIADLFLNTSSYNYGYNGQQVVLKAVDEGKVTFESPVLKDNGGVEVPTYKIAYSIYPVSVWADPTKADLLSDVEEKTQTVNTNSTTFEFTLSVDQDGLAKNKTYYASVMPMDIYDTPGTPSKQLCFNLAQKRAGVGDECTNFDTPAKTEHPSASTTSTTSTSSEHPSAGVDMSLANVSHTANEDSITLRWTALDGGDEIDIYVFDEDDETYTRVATVDMSDEKYTYKMTWDGEHIFKFIPSNGGKEIIYEVNAMRSTPKKEETKPIDVVPKTGPTENLFVAILATALLYGGYRVYKRQKA